MANFYTFFAPLLKKEGGFVDHDDDPGGATNLGITLATWRTYGNDLDGDGDIDVDDIRLLTESDALPVYKKIFWDSIYGDQIHNQSLAEIMFDHGVNAGPKRAVGMVQYLLNRHFGKGLDPDGKMGPNTLGALNSVNANRLYNYFRELRMAYYNWRANYPDKVTPQEQALFKSLGVWPSNSARSFIKGWINRVLTFPKKKIVWAVGLTSLIILSFAVVIINNSTQDEGRY